MRRDFYFHPKLRHKVLFPFLRISGKFTLNYMFDYFRILKIEKELIC